MTAPRPPAPEALSPALATAYAARRAPALARQLADEADGDGVPWVVDGFAGADLQRAALRGMTVEAAAVGMVRAMEGAGVPFRAILVEEDPALLARVGDALGALGLGNRVRRADALAALAPGDVALVEAPFAAAAPSVAEAVGDAPALVRLAPLSARALPWPALAPLVGLAGADVLVQLPADDFLRQGRFTGPLADLPPHLRRLVEGCSALLGEPAQMWLPAWRAAAGGGDAAALDAMRDRLRARIADAAEGRTVRAVAAEAEGAALHVLLAVTDAADALELNGAIADAGATPDGAPPPAPPPVPRAPAPPAALDLFPLPPPPPPPPAPAGPDLGAVADDLHARHVGTRVPWRALLAGLAESGLTPEQVRAALAHLKRAGLASYRSLDAEGAEVEFRAEPKEPAPRRPRARKARPEEIGLFDDLPDD